MIVIITLIYDSEWTIYNVTILIFKESRTDKDEDNCKRINELLNNPSSAVQSSNNPDQDLQSLLNNMSQSQLMQLFGGGVGQIGGLSSLLGTLRWVFHCVAI